MGNWLLAALLTLALIGGAILATDTEKAGVQERQAYSETIVGNMMVYRNRVVAYADTHTTVDGTVADSNLGLPAWFRRNSNVVNYVKNGLGYVYYNVSNEGQAYEMLKKTKNDVNVGIKRGGFLYNPIAGLTSIALPAEIPDGSVVFAPASRSTATAPPPPPGPPANCTVGAGTTRSWTVGANSCSGAQGAAQTVPHLGTLAFNDPTPGNTGAAAYYCVNGALQSTPEDGATCIPPPACNVPAGTSRTWTVGGATCSGPRGPATVPSGTSLTFTSTNGNNGAAGYLCNEGSLSATPDGSQTCVVPPAPCVLPSPSSQSETEGRTASQTLACPAGYTGSITQTRPEQRTRSRSAYCPAPTGAYAWGAFSAWSAWAATGGWSTTSNTCVVICTLPSPSSQSQSQTVTQDQTVACPAGQTGSGILLRRNVTQTQTRSAYCPAPTGNYAWGGWSAWADTAYGGWAEISRSCTTPCTAATRTDYNQPYPTFPNNHPFTRACTAAKIGQHAVWGYVSCSSQGPCGSTGSFAICTASGWSFRIGAGSSPFVPIGNTANLPAEWTAIYAQSIADSPPGGSAGVRSWTTYQCGF